MAFSESSRAVVLIGRNDKTKPSSLILAITDLLRASGLSVHEFESDRLKVSREINERMARKWPRFAADPKQLPAHWWILRSAIKSILALKSKRRWDFLQAALWSPPAKTARELNCFLASLPEAKAWLITHSAGGIAATKAAVAPGADRIDRIVSFGYPFRHPDRAAEGYRTNHLPAIRKPFMIVQGICDAYGSDPALFGALLPIHAKVVMVDCSHGYSDLPPIEFEKTWAKVSEFLGVPTDPLSTN